MHGDSHSPSTEDAPVPCPGCGRAYDAARFGGGRTLVCVCGARVGRPLARTLASPPRFAADDMLGGLARRLRALGYDVTWDGSVADADLVRRAVAEGRVILTRDAGLVEDWQVDGMMWIAADAPLDQLREVAGAYGLSAGRLFTRCTRCNEPLEPAAAEDDEMAAAVPPAVRAAGAPLARCPACRRVYWEGSHTRRMRETLERALASGPSGAPGGDERDGGGPR